MQFKLTNSKIPFASLLLIAPFFLWGTAMVAMKGTISHTTPLFMAGVRTLPAGVLVIGGAAWLGRSQPRGWAAWLWIGGFALIDAVMFQGFLAEGLVKTGAGLGSVMIDSQPIAVALMARFLFAEWVGLWGWLGLTLGIAGISLLGLPDDWIVSLIRGDISFLTWQFGSDVVEALFQNGEWLMLLAALSMAAGTVMIRYVIRFADPIMATGWHMLIGGAVLFALSAQWESHQWTYLTVSDGLALSYATIFGSAIAYGLFFYFASTGSLTSISSLTFLTPVFALLFGNLFLGETLSFIQWIGVLLTLISIYLINQRDALSARIGGRQTEWIEPDDSPASVDDEAGVSL
ncbi:MAG: DMT family transporter [Elainellaceae cyanobacterium]